MRKQRKKQIIWYFAEDEKLLKSSEKNGEDNLILIEDKDEIFKSSRKQRSWPQKI